MELTLLLSINNITEVGGNKYENTVENGQMVYKPMELFG